MFGYFNAIKPLQTNYFFTAIESFQIRYCMMVSKGASESIEFKVKSLQEHLLKMNFEILKANSLTSGFDGP